MKLAKVVNGVVHHVWPWEKTLPDGTKVIKELPPQYRPPKPRPSCIIEVPDDVQPKWVWNGEKYAPMVKRPLKKWKTIREIVREELEKLLAAKKD